MFYFIRLYTDYDCYSLASIARHSGNRVFCVDVKILLCCFSLHAQEGGGGGDSTAKMTGYSSEISENIPKRYKNIIFFVSNSFSLLKGTYSGIIITNYFLMT